MSAQAAAWLWLVGAGVMEIVWVVFLKASEGFSRLGPAALVVVSIALSFFLGMFVAAGMAFYWICSNLLSILVQIVCNIIIKPANLPPLHMVALQHFAVQAQHLLQHIANSQRFPCGVGQCQRWCVQRTGIQMARFHLEIDLR